MWSVFLQQYYVTYYLFLRITVSVLACWVFVMKTDKLFSVIIKCEFEYIRQLLILERLYFFFGFPFIIFVLRMCKFLIFFFLTWHLIWTAIFMLSVIRLPAGFCSFTVHASWKNQLISVQIPTLTILKLPLWFSIVVADQFLQFYLHSHCCLFYIIKSLFVIFLLLPVLDNLIIYL